MEPVKAAKTSMKTPQFKDIHEEESLKPIKCFPGFRADSIAPDFVLMNEIGRGVWGVVHKAVCKICDYNIAVKEVEEYPRKNAAATELELRNLLHLKKHKHPNIIQFFGSVKQIPKRLLFF